MPSMQELQYKLNQGLPKTRGSKIMRYLLASLAVVALMATACTRNRQYDCCEVVINETYLHKYGVEVPSEDWTARGEDGKVISTLKTGVVIAKSFSAGQLDGETTYSFPHSDVAEKVETYSQGTLVKEVINDRSGTPKQQTVYDSPESKTITLWYENGSPQSVEQYLGDRLLRGEYYTTTHQLESSVENGSGTRIVRDESGQLLGHDNFANAQIVSKATFYANGSPKEVIPYRAGTVDGIKKTFMPGGEPASIEMWINGKQDGLTVLYQHGEKQAEVFYVKGYKEGIEKHYRDGNAVVEEITWKEGKRTGPTTIYVGNNETTDWYFQDKQVSQSVYEQMTRPVVLR